MRKLSALFFLILVSMASVSLSVEADYGESSESLGQFTDEFIDLDNVSVQVEVVRNETFNAMELNYSAGISNFQNFSEYTHTDPQNKVIPDTYNISWINYERDDAGRTVFDFGVNAIRDFNWFFEFRLSDLDAGDADSRGFLFVLVMDQTDSVGFAPDHYTMIQLVQVGNNDNLYEWWMTTKDGTSQNTIGVSHLNVGTVYYCNFFRNGQNKTLNIYTDSAMINQVEHISHNKGTNHYRYLQTIKMISSGNDPADDSSGYLNELYDTTKGSGGYVSEGYFTTTDYLDQANGSILALLTNSTIPANTVITIEFSEDNVTWTLNDWEPIFGGFEAIDLRELNWSGSCYLRYNLSTTNGELTPRLYQSRLITTQGDECAPSNGDIVVQESDFPWVAIAIILMCVAYLLARQYD